MATLSDFARRHGGTEEEVRLNRLSEEIIGAGLEIHRALGPGLLESVYETILARELGLRGLHVQRQVALPVVWKDEVLEESFRIDLLIEGAVVVELKSVERSAPVHKKQLITYVRLSGVKLGLLLNFGTDLFKDGVERVVWGQFE